MAYSIIRSRQLDFDGVIDDGDGGDGDGQLPVKDKAHRVHNAPWKSTIATDMKHAS